jgi:hypothetical protein
MVTKTGFQVEREGASAIPLPLAFPGMPRPALAPALGLLDVATRLAPTVLGFQLLALARKT